MQKNRLIFHLGFPKTATTSLQKNLDSSKIINLGKGGLLSSSRDAKLAWYKMMDSAEKANDTHEFRKFQLSYLAEVQTYLFEEFQNQNTVLLTDESLTNRIGLPSLFAVIKLIEIEVIKILDTFSTSWSPEYVFTIRNQPDLIESLIAFDSYKYSRVRKITSESWKREVSSKKKSSLIYSALDLTIVSKEAKRYLNNEINFIPFELIKACGFDLYAREVLGGNFLNEKIAMKNSRKVDNIQGNYIYKIAFYKKLIRFLIQNSFIRNLGRKILKDKKHRKVFIDKFTRPTLSREILKLSSSEKIIILEFYNFGNSAMLGSAYSIQLLQEWGYVMPGAE